jgi:3-methylcrotonyl-CoA carboxylase alpha subunit
MLKKILIANRGEIAQRVIRTASRLGVETVAVVSDADRGAPFARLAGELVEIGPGPASESYLRGDRIIAAAEATGADAIHPGYGFLAENAGFAEAVRAAGLVFIGPSGEAMRRMGGKAEAKAIAAKAGVPVVPGYGGESQSDEVLAREARRIGYPLLIKAIAGGGGRGMRVVARAEDFAAALESAGREAQAAFGDGRLMLEKLIERPRHIEVQVFGDRHGNVVHLFERDCTLQRRHQKVIEEAPAPGMSPELRQRMCAAAVACARAVAYEGAGTVEFLVEGGALGPDAPWYFIEMNTRLQVEHPVTEAITGLDLVEWQLRVASGEPLPLRQAEIAMTGHAVEARLCAEDPARRFLPSTGPLVRFELPVGEGVRVDAGTEEGQAVSPFYDSLLAKLIAWAPDRAAAIGRLAGALEHTAVAGPRTNTAFLHALLHQPAFVAGRMDTGLIDREIEGLTAAAPDPAAIAWGVTQMLRRAHANGRQRTWGEAPSPWDADDGFQLGPPRSQRLTVLADQVPTVVEVVWGPAGPSVHLRESDGPAAHPNVIKMVWGPREPSVRLPGPDGVDATWFRLTWDSTPPFYLLHAMRQTELAWPSWEADALTAAGDGSSIRAPIVGRVAKVLVKPGAAVAKGDRIAIVEAMKMEHVLHAARDGIVASVAVREGDQVTEGALIAALEAKAAAP